MQPQKRCICSKCGKELANRHNLSRHKKSCQSAPYNIPVRYPTYKHGKAVMDSQQHFTKVLPTTDKRDFNNISKSENVSSQPQNPKIQALLDEIINDDDSKRNAPLYKGFSIVPPTTTSLSSNPSKPPAAKSHQRQHSTLTTREEPVIKKIKLSSARSKKGMRNLPQPKHIEYSDTDSDAESPVDDNDDDDANDDRKMHHPRTKGQIIGYEDDDQEQHIEKQLSPTDEDDEELEDRFNHLLIEYTREKKPESGHELAMLLDIMLDRGLVTAIEYSKLNSSIAAPPAADEDEIDASDKEEEEDEEEEAEGEMGRIIKETVDYVIRLDKEELSGLLMELRDEVGGGEFLDALIDLDLLAGKFLENEFEDGAQLLPLIEEKRLALEASPAPPSKLLRVKILLDDLQNNRHRIQEIFQRIDDAVENEEDIWKLLVREGLISDEQFEKLSQLENTELEEISSILKGVKSGQGISFLPTTMAALRYTFGQLWKAGDGKNKILPVLKELLRRGGMTEGQYSILVDELHKL